MDRKRKKLTPGKNYVKKECQEAEITALKQNLADMGAKLMRVTAELEQVKEERVRDKIDFETEKCELKSKIDKYKEQCTELQSEIEKFQSENEKLQKYLQDLESANITVEEEKRQKNLCNTGLNSQITKVYETNDDTSNINALPNEIILKVFSYLTQNQLGQIARVCRKWNELTKSPLLWRKVNVEIFSSDRRMYTSAAVSFINRLPPCVTFIRLDFLKLCGKLDFEELCLKLQQNCPHVEELILACCGISNILPEVINFCTQFLQDLKKLVFRYCDFDDYFGTVELNYNSKMKVLDLYSCRVFDYSKTQFSKLLCLKELRFNQTAVYDTWFGNYTYLWNQLHVLDLGQTRITAKTFRAIQRHGLNLKELYLCNFYLQDHDLNFNKSSFPHLRTICLSDNCVTCEGVLSLIQSCPSLENVYVLERVAVSFTAHPFANRCKEGIVKAINWNHNHNVDYSHH